MPTTANAAFNYYRANIVDLDPVDSTNARTSRDFLIEQIKLVAEKKVGFPELFGTYMPYGSFARKTKTRPLDDVDIFVFLHGRGGTQVRLDEFTYTAQISDQSAPIWKYTNEYDHVNSTQILNQFKSALQDVHQYQNSDIKRTHEAIVLNLKSYEWSFDIIPVFRVYDSLSNLDDTLYYLMPDGNGNWKQTDPRRDQNSITTANQKHNGYLIPLIRLIKYWNSNSYSAPKVGSYYLETMLINGFNSEVNLLDGIKVNVPKAFRHLANQIMLVCPDPKGLGPNLDSGLVWQTRNKFGEVATNMAQFADYALMYENDGDQKQAIYWWSRVFPGFPEYD